ncbi:hypothetical protein A3A64_02800 [Candidatus Gottesmanbacteria bacterium RIFCSPLOWO2_01_FULL_48_11]|uniref:Uncharacterized protein n=2 Tax=Candidatus Gottesmaniibacteriota TaxID=1752720 RepID=A0A0G1TZT0_9BACT|nr:MAG: hypothetical protein UY16_C0030G0011 [Candidatus Gottesmanbacteria bacterium GW2011_GWA2_47_9]OGG27542.1 MAG: hypothetical protein A3A64_02800 [Candidatus Gottesmanbacteria bacterium RIFCSPLOWO2_01_FULL_48_11]
MKAKTINISLSQGLYDEAKKHQREYHYSALSELIRDALRWWLNPRLTRNGFTPEFEREVLRAEKEADAGSVVEWDGKGSFHEFVMSHPAPPPSYSKNRIRRKISSKLSKARHEPPGVYRQHRGAYPVV